MSEAIPLGAALCIECVDIIKGFALSQVLDLMFERLAMKTGDFWLVQWQTDPINILHLKACCHYLLQRYRFPCFDLCRGGFHSCGCKKIEST